MFDDELLEEERRLAYVGITRAKKRLFLSHARTRMLYNARSANELSRFVSEIPARLITDGTQRGEQRRVPPPPSARARADVPGAYGVRREAGVRTSQGRAMGIPGVQKGFGGNYVASQARTVKAITLFKPGDKVIHRSFGRGQVLEVSGQGQEQKVKVDFGERGVRTFSASIAPIIKVED